MQHDGQNLATGKRQEWCASATGALKRISKTAVIGLWRKFADLNGLLAGICRKARLKTSSLGLF
jgi:hypothetical protein